MSRRMSNMNLVPRDKEYKILLRRETLWMS